MTVSNFFPESRFWGGRQGVWGAHGEFEEDEGREEERRILKGRLGVKSALPLSHCYSGIVLLTPDGVGAWELVAETQEEGTACILVALRHPERLAFQGAMTAAVTDGHSSHCSLLNSGHPLPVTRLISMDPWEGGRGHWPYYTHGCSEKLGISPKAIIQDSSRVTNYPSSPKAQGVSWDAGSEERTRPTREAGLSSLSDCKAWLYCLYTPRSTELKQISSRGGILRCLTLPFDLGICSPLQRQALDCVMEISLLCSVLPFQAGTCTSTHP